MCEIKKTHAVEQLCTSCLNEIDANEQAYHNGFIDCETLLTKEIEAVLLKLVEAKRQYDEALPASRNEGNPITTSYHVGKFSGMSHAVEILEAYVYGILKA